MENKIDIVLPNRIGDLILSLPAIICLRQLIERYGSDHLKPRLVTRLPLADVLQALNLFEVLPMNAKTKIKSWLRPAGKAFFLSTTSKNIGYHAKVSCGKQLSNKKLIRYSVNLPYLSSDPDHFYPKELVNFLKGTIQLPGYAIRHFGICLELGYTVEQILETFRFDETHLALADDFFGSGPELNSRYLVFCMEAAYGRTKHNSDRRWNEECYFELADRAHDLHKVTSVFVGINNFPELPQREYFVDLRQKLSLGQIVRLLHYSCGYVGNDTGPLHLANLAKKRSIGMYFRERDVVGYHPVFPRYNEIVFKPQSSEEIYQSLDALLDESVATRLITPSSPACKAI